MYNHISKCTDQIYFGKYIDHDVLTELQDVGIDLIVDTTTQQDELQPYQHGGISRIHFPIPDMDVVSDANVIELIHWLTPGILKGGKVYIHCKGGHGRSGVIAACLYGYMYKTSGVTALEVVYKAHQERQVMKDMWRELGCPQTHSQKKQVLRILG